MREMKDSGMEWIGEIPKHWDLRPIRAVFYEVNDKNSNGSVKNALKFTYGNIVRKNNFEADEDEYVANTIMNYIVVHPGTIMLNGLNLNFDFISQRIGLVNETGVITSAYMAFAPIDKSYMSSNYANYLFKSYDNCKAFHNMGGGVRKILNFGEFKKYYVFIPPFHEQQLIADFLDRKCAEIDALTADIQSQIDTLEQYKRSVITETVTKGLNPDVEMKDSGIEWVGEIPRHWDSIKIKYLASVRDENGFFNPEYDTYIGLENITSYSNLLIPTNTIYAASTQSICKKNDVLFGKLRPYLAKAIISPFNGFCSSEFLVLYDFDGDSRFLRYSLLNECCIKKIDSSTYGTKMPRANSNYILNLLMPFPPYSEQHYIADFLDQKCAKIEEIIGQKREQITVLEEYKKSLIFEYVTGKKEVPIL